MWKRGWWSFSSWTTLRPWRRSRVAAVEPPGPPPTTSTSQSIEWFACCTMRSLVLRRRGARAWYILVVAAAASVAATPQACVHVSTPTPVPSPSSSAPPAPASRAFAYGLSGYVALALAGWLTGDTWLDVLAAFALVTLFLLPGLRDRSVAAWLVWLASGALLGLLAAR